ncbi:MAG: hypothetical protein U5K55_05355 [Aliarcobacter sp.]|nr:hypothetical protein [Aliarcobacter sp.]
MLNITLLSSVAKSALVGAIATKIVDTLISTKINNTIEQGKWLRNTKLDLFSKLTEDILSIDLSNVDTQIREIKKTSAKIILLINDKKLSDKMEVYINNLNKYNASKREEQITLSLINKDMISYLQRNIRL